MSSKKNKKLTKVKLGGINYIISHDFSVDFFASELSSNLAPLGTPEEYRSVWLCKGLGAVVKYNQLKGLRRRLFAHFGWQGVLGKYSLINEYENLKALSHLDFIPKVYAFGRCDSFPLEKEVLVVEYYENSLTADEMIIKYPERRYEIVRAVFELFLNAWEAGFAHMDPHPKNILFDDFDALRFIDFECCCLAVEDKEFYFGFSMGYFFHYWFYKYFEVSEYSDFVYSFMGKHFEELDIVRFDLFYKKFKNFRVSRAKRYKCFYNADQRAKLIGSDR